MTGWRRRLFLCLVALVLLIPLAFDLHRPPSQQWSARALIKGIHLYQATLSPKIGAIGVVCRFKPTCSHYAEGAIAKSGALVGTIRAGWRILRCGPWTPLGTVDPP
jgi:putative membrane protein insertion efficiency factor